MDARRPILQALFGSATILSMRIWPGAVEAKTPSKFHGAYHQQLRMQVQGRRLQAFSLYLQGMPLTEIADEIGVDYSTAWRYVRRELNACRLANAEAVEAVRAQQANVLNGIVRQALEAWECSCQKGETRLRMAEIDGPKGAVREKVKQIERTAGDPRFLEVALKGLAEIRALYGIGVPGSGATIGKSNPIQILTRWGGELQPAIGNRPEVDDAEACDT
jgi:hypothetical protein